MMAHIGYLDILPSKEAMFYKRLMLDMESNSINFQRNADIISKKLLEQIKESPYPILQILQETILRKSPIIENSIYSALEDFIINDSLKAGELPLQFINFIANFHLFAVQMAQVRLRLLPEIVSLNNDNLFIALIARDGTMLLDDLLRLRAQSPSVAVDFPSKEGILQDALINKRHFVVSAISQQKDFNEITDVATRNLLIILKISSEFSNITETIETIGNLGQMLDSFVIHTADLPAELEKVHQFFYADFNRIRDTIDFLQRFSETSSTTTTTDVPINAIIESNGILQLLYDYKNILLIGYDETKKIIETCHHWESLMPGFKQVRDQELETLTYFFALVTIYDIIVAKVCTDAFAATKLTQLHVMLRQVRNIDILCSLIEDIFQLIFLRWEHLYNQQRRCSADANNRQKSTKSDAISNSSSTGIETPPPTVVINLPHPIKQGFICRGRALRAIFNFLKNFVTKKLHSEEYKNSPERIQIRFTRIFDIITEALWKYAVLEKIIDWNADSTNTSCRFIEPEDLLQLIQLHSDIVEKTSSDDESRERSNYISLTRRKAAVRKRRRATFSGATASVHLERLQEKRAQLTISKQNHNAEHNICSQLSHSADRSIIPKMLGTPENLAIMALAMKNFNDVKYIIQNFHLNNTELDRELVFMEQQQQQRQKLSTIYDFYEKQEEQNSQITQIQQKQQQQPVAAVEKIRKVIAKGFEASKIISIIDNFAQTRTIRQSDDIRQLLEKYSNYQYPFLTQYLGSNLQICFVIDLILTLPFNYEITSNILTVIRRNQNQNYVTDHKDDTIKQSNLPKEIGCIPLLENLCECMRLLQQQQQQISLRNLLIDNFYSLKPHKLAIELDREKNFTALFAKKPNDIGRCEDLKLHTNRFVEFKSKINYYHRFITYVGNLRKIIQLRDRNLEFHTNELLKYDVRDIIGELIFEHNMTPLEIEGNVVALNLNMVHMIALNFCPEIAISNVSAEKINQKRCFSTQPDKVKYKTIFNYISNQNELLGFLLQQINNTCTQQQDDETIITMNNEYLQRYLELPEIVNLSNIYDGNAMIAVLCSDHIDLERIKKLPSQLMQLKILLAFSDKFKTEIDNLISNLISNDAKYVYLINQMSNISQRAVLIQKNFTKVESSHMAKDLIESLLHHRDAEILIDSQLRNQLEHTLSDITVYSQVSDVLQFESWPQAYDFGMKTPNIIMEKLLLAGHFELCYNWCEVVDLAKRFSQQLRSFFNIFLEIFLNITTDNEIDCYLLRIVETFPQSECIQFYDTHKDKFRSIGLLNYIIDFLAKNVKSSTSPSSFAYKNYKVSLKILEQLNQRERDQFWNLLRYPLLIIEQLIMNAKFEILTKVLTVVRPMLIDEENEMKEDKCEFCFDKRGNIYDIHSKNGHNSKQFTLGSTDNNSSAFILLNFNLYQVDHIIKMECVDLLLRIYATKALDYQISEGYSSSSERVSQSTDMASLDSLCGTFLMPKTPPTRDNWTKDDEAIHCMCCRRAVFTMLMRRHHCRRCGRVVCFACSTNRIRIPELYAEIEVRVCNDCHQQTTMAVAIIKENSQGKYSASIGDDNRFDRSEKIKWQLSGNITHDKLLREEFCYEHAPSVALCLSILSFHYGNKKCVDLLLYHCRKLEKLLVPSPEVNFELIAKMMNCLALAAKVRGGPPEVETIREHSDIIMSIVQNGCEKLIPVGPINNHSLRKLGDSLVQAEKWQLALEVHLKCGFPTAGVMAAHGLSCLRAGCFETAREKFSHCMQKVSMEFENANIYKNITGFSQNTENRETEIPRPKRPKRSPPLLLEIIKILESIPYTKPQPETLARASIIRNSNSSLASMMSRRKENIPLHEPALNILSTLANLKHLSKGQYCNGSGIKSSPILENIKHLQRQTRIYEECLYYVLTYGSHSDVIRFFIRHQELKSALRYFILQNLDTDHFIRNIFLSFLRCGEVPLLIEQMHEIDNNLSIWNDVLIQTCRYLEKKNLLNSLYQLQILLKDPIRASMTCVKFYTINCESFQQLQDNAIHLYNAQKHLQAELELSQWENINLEGKRSRRSSTTTNVSQLNFLMQMDARALNGHINTILRQLDVTKFLAKCEKEHKQKQQQQQQRQQQKIEDINENFYSPELITETILKQIRIDATATKCLPTLFDSPQEKMQICILLLLSGKNIEEGFGLAYRIIQDYKLPQMKVFGATTKYLARNSRLMDVEHLINCITSNNSGGGGTSNRDIDELLSIAINSACNNHEPEVRSALDSLVKKINNVELRISCHIFIGQLKSAYLLANKYERIADIRRILRQAEASNQVHIKKLCEKKLNLNQPQL